MQEYFNFSCVPKEGSYFLGEGTLMQDRFYHRNCVNPENRDKDRIDFWDKNERKDKYAILDQSVNDSIVNSKLYTDLKKQHLQNKKLFLDTKQKLTQKISEKRRETEKLSLEE